MGFKIGNPLKSVSNAVSNTVKNVSNEFNKTRETFERSDLGKVTSVAARPVTTALEVQKDLLKGNFSTAGKRMAGFAAQNTNPWSHILDTSSTLKGIVARDNFFGSYAKSAEAFEKLRSGQSLSNEDVRHITQANVKSAAIVGGVYAGATYGQSAALWMGKNKVTTAFIGSQLVGAAKSGNFQQAIQNIGNKLSPGAGDFLDSIVSPNPKYPTDNYLPNYDGVAPTTSNNFTKIALISAGIILILAIFKKMRSK
ncbi:MAG: hypothetical protein ACK41T_01070 [Pseudobdellovibrio sp.]